MKLKSVTFLRAKFANPVSVDFTAEQRSNDPGDALRYDVAFVNPADPTVIAFPIFRTRLGDLGGIVVSPMWASHGVVLDTLFETASDALGRKEQMTCDATQWITFRHPRDSQERRDYTKLVPVTLAEFLKSEHKDSTNL